MRGSPHSTNNYTMYPQFISLLLLGLLSTNEAKASLRKRNAVNTPRSTIQRQRTLLSNNVFNRTSPESRIVGGVEAEDGEWPFYVHAVDGEVSNKCVLMQNE